jgi:hypothetical protein
VLACQGGSLSSIATVFNRIPHRIHSPSPELAIPYAKVGVEMEVENFKLNRSSIGKLLPNWDLHTEERSLRNKGMELTTAGGLVGKLLVDEIRLFCKIAKEKKWSEGFPRAGLHVHIDVTDMNADRDVDLLYFVQTYMLFEHALFSFAGEWRRSCGFCDSLLASQADWPYMGKMLLHWNYFESVHLHPNYFSKYQALNFLPMKDFGTLEFRHLPQTFDDARILSWINLILAMKAYALTTRDGPMVDLQTNGPQRLFEMVFGEWARPLVEHVSQAAVVEASREVLSMEILLLEPPLDPWGNHDNPYLNIKLAKVKEKEPFAE